MTTTGVRPPEVEAPEIDPRIEARRLDVQRQSHQRRMRSMLVVASVCIVAALAYLTVHSPLLDVDHLEVVTTPHVPADDVLEASGIERGDALYDVDAVAAAQRIEALPWVASARVVRSFPNTVRISVREHDVAAFLRRPDGTFALVAGDGRVVANAPSAPAQAVEVVGVRRVPAIDRLLSPPAVAGVVRHLPPRLADEVIAIDLTDDVVALVLRRGGQVRLGNLDDLDAKGAAALAVLDRVGAEPFAYIDVRVPAAPVVGGSDR